MNGFKNNNLQVPYRKAALKDYKIPEKSPVTEWFFAKIQSKALPLKQ